MRRVMWGLPQADILANKLLRQRLLPHGYYKCTNTPGLWKHEWRPISFTLVVDDFGVKYVGKEHVEHLIRCIKETYKLTEDWTGNLYCGITLVGNNAKLTRVTDRQLGVARVLKHYKPLVQGRGRE